MRKCFAVAIGIFVPAFLCGSPCSADILSGPFINPANGHSYSLLSKNTWTGAEAEAISRGGHLPTVRNQAENDWLRTTFLPFISEETGSLLIGFTTPAHDANFSWTSGEPTTFTNWGAGEPNNIGTEFYTNLLLRNFSVIVAGQWNNINNGNASLPQYGVLEVVPEPATLGIFGAAITLTALGRKRRRAPIT